MDTLNFDVFEGMTSISALIGAILSGTNNRKIIKVFYNESSAKKKSREIAFLTHKSRELNFELVPTDSEFIDSIADGKTHGGFLAFASKREFTNVDPHNIKQNGFYALIDGIEDPYNFGYCVRSLYASGADGLILPTRNWMEASGTVARSSAGTSELFDIFVDDPENAVLTFKNMGFKVMCAEIRDSVSLYDADLTGPILFIIGGEKRGISRAVLELADKIVRIDYGTDFRGSLSSSASAAVFAFEIFRYNKK